MKLSNDLQHFLNESKNCVCVCINKSEVATDWEVVFLNSAIINKFSMVKEIKLPADLKSLAPEIIGADEIELGEKAFFKHEKITCRKHISSDTFGELVIDFTFFKIDNFLVFEIQNITNNVIAENDLSLTTSTLNEVYQIAEMHPFEVYLSTGIIKTTFKLHEFFDEQNKNKVYSIADLQSLISAQTKNESKQNIEKLKTDNQPFRIERMITTATGLEKYVEVSGKSILLNDKSEKLIGTFRDITKRKTEEKKIKEAESKIIENANLIKYAHEYYDIGTFTINKHSKKITSDYNFSLLFESKEPIGEITLSMLQTLCSSPEDVIDSNSRINEAFNSFKPFTKERKLTTEAGNIKYIEFNFLPLIENGVCDNLFCIFRNVTQRNERELRILQSEQILKEKDTTVMVAHDLLKIGTYQLDLKTNKAVVNTNIKRILEMPLNDDNLSLQFYNERVILEKGEKTVNEIIAENIKAKSSYIINRRVRTESGRIIYVENAGQPIFDEQGVPIKLVGTFRDITDQKEVELELLKNKQLIEFAHNNLEMGTYTIDLTTGILETDYDFSGMLEMPVKQNKFKPEDFEIYSEKGELEHSIALANNIISTKQPYTYIRKFITYSKKEIYLEVNVVPIIEGDGEINKLFGIFRNITERKQQELKLIAADKALKENARIVNYAHENLKMGTYNFNLTTQLIETDFNYIDFFDLNQNHISLNIAEYLSFLSEFDRDDTPVSIKNVIANNVICTKERKVITPKGNIKYLEVSAQALFENEICNNIIGTFRDVTIKKNQELQLLEADKTLKQKDELLNKAHQLIVMGTYEIDFATGIVSSELDLAKMFELLPSNMPLKIDDYKKMLMPDDNKNFEKDVLNAKQHKIKYTAERKIKTPNGNIKYIEILGIPIFDEQSNLIKLQGTLRDITERKSKEEQLKITEQKLTETVKMLEIAHAQLRMGTYIVDLSTKQITSTLDIKELYELPDEKNDFTLDDYFKYINKEELEESKLIFKKLIESGISFSRERKITTAKNNDKFVEITGNPFYENGLLTKITGTFRDITFRKKLENKLLNTEIKLLEAESLLRMGTFEFDLVANKIEHSIELSKLLEIKNLKPIETVDEFITYVHDDDKLVTAQYIQALISGENLKDTVQRKMITQNGNIKYFEIVSKVTSVNNVVIKFSGTFRDITEQIVQQNLMIDNQKRLEEANLMLKNGTFTYQLNSKMVSLSDEVSAILDFKIPKKLHIVDFFKFIPHSKRNDFFNQFIHIIENQQELKQIVKLIFDDNTYRYIDITGQLTKDEEFYKGTFRDITEQHEKDIALKRSEEKFRELFENTPSMYFIIDHDFKISSVNQFGADYLGFQKHEIIGKNCVDLFYNEDKKIAVLNLELLKKNEANFSQWEIRKRKKSGEIIWVKETARIITSSNDSVFFLIVCEDITNEIQNRLLVKRKQDELLKAKEKAEVAMYEKQQFTSIMSHEIRTPLNAVIGMTNVLLMENPRENQIAELNTLKFAAENLLVLVNDILDFSKIESGKVQLEKISFDIHKLVHNIKTSYKFKADEKGIFINSTIDNDVPNIIIGDPMRISQILNNLVSNAVKFTESGFVEVSLRKVIHMNENEIKIRFEVSDTGIGIPTSKMKIVFESFSQANIDTTRKYGGTGLGLTITQKLIQLYKSEIDVQSEVGKGSTFSFDIVFILPEKNSVDKNSFFVSERSTSNEIKKVLLVEDNEINRIVTVKFLKRWNLDVDTAVNGKEAIDKLESGNFDLVLMDIHMPEMNGVEATQIIRKHENHELRNIPIIALTAAAVDNERETLIQDGLSDYISKPFNPAELHDKIFKYLSN